MQGLDRDFQIVDVIMRIPLTEADIEVRFPVLVPTDEVFPGNHTDVTLPAADEIIRCIGNSLMIFIMAVRNREGFLAVRNTVIELRAPCTAFIAVGHAITVQIYLKIIIRIKRIVNTKASTKLPTSSLTEAGIIDRKDAVNWRRALNCQNNIAFSWSICRYQFHMDIL